MDGLIFELVPVHGRPKEACLRRPAASDSRLIQQAPGRGWAAYILDPITGGFHSALSEFVAPNQEEAIRYAYLIDAFYRIRRRRELAWLGNAAAVLAAIPGMLTTPQPLMVLCGIAPPGACSRFTRREWVCGYSGDSEAEARWNYDAREEDGSPACLLVDPAREVVDSCADSKDLW